MAGSAQGLRSPFYPFAGLNYAVRSIIQPIIQALMEKASKGRQEAKIIKISIQSNVKTAEELQPMDLTLLP